MPDPRGGLERKQCLQFCRADEVVFRYAVYGMGHVSNGRLVVADCDVGMVVLAVGNPGNGIDERHGLIMIFELETFLHPLALVLPSRNAFQHMLYLCQCHWRNAAFTWYAFLACQAFGQFTHAEFRRMPGRRE